MPERKVGGQKQRQAPGKWERMTNKQQRRLVRAYDTWSAKVRKLLLNASDRGAPRSELTAMVERYLPELENTLLEITRKGIAQAVRTEAGDKADLPPVRAVVNRQIAENNQLVKEALIPRIREKLVDSITRGEQMDKKVLSASFMPLRSAAAAYAGGAWVMIFMIQQQLGRVREQERRREGLAVEPVRWVLDPAAEHCHDSGGYHGCVELAGVYQNGWDSLITVPAGRTTCRGNCVLPGNGIDVTNIKAAFRASYSGPAIEFITESGIKFSVTANHPVLTPQGWLRAKLLHKGDYVINSTHSESPVMVVDDDHKDMPPFIEQIWDALSVVPIINTSPSSTIMPDDFHGDGRFMYGDVDIVLPFSQLGSDVSDSSTQHTPDNDTLHRGLLAQCPLSAQCPRMKVYRPSLTTSNGRVVSVDLISSLVGAHPTPLDLLGFTLASKMDSLSFDSVGDSPSAYTQVLRQLKDTFARLVTLDKITDVVYFNYSGHVYDLQTDVGYYLLNSNIQQRQGIVNSNCRCHLEVKVKGKWQRGL